MGSSHWHECKPQQPCEEGAPLYGSLRGLLTGWPAPLSSHLVNQQSSAVACVCNPTNGELFLDSFGNKPLIRAFRRPRQAALHELTYTGGSRKATDTQCVPISRQSCAERERGQNTRDAPPQSEMAKQSPASSHSVDSSSGLWALCSIFYWPMRRKPLRGGLSRWLHRGQQEHS